MTVDAGAASRVVLSPIVDPNAVDPVPWLAEAWCAIDGLRPGPDAPTTMVALRDAVGRRWPGARIDLVDVASRGIGGFIVWEDRGDGEPAIVIRGLAIRRDWRNLGYGGEAVERLEALRAGECFVAAIPRWNGLAVYFWLRTGFRPVRDDEDRERARDPGHLWMLRAMPAGVSDGRLDP